MGMVSFISTVPSLLALAPAPAPLPPPTNTSLAVYRHPIHALESGIATCIDVGSLPHNDFVSTVQSFVPSTFIGSTESTLGYHLARRLVQIGVDDVFSVPGDFNLNLFDRLLAEPGLNLVCCCNELNADYVLDVGWVS